ncbi:hypothetical protein RI367_004719 [Sorochytrium milnesiophthora]
MDDKDKTPEQQQRQPSREALEDAIREILKDSNWDEISRGQLRSQLATQFGVDLTERKTEIRDITDDVVEELEAAKAEREREEDIANMVVEVKEPKRAASRKVATSSPPSTAGKAKKKKRKATSDDDEDGGDKPKKRSNSAFMRPQVLSPALAAVLNQSELSRPEVVKSLWQYIRDNNLQDQKDKRWIITDDRLKQVFSGQKRIHMFTMNKELSAHLAAKEELV